MGLSSDAAYRRHRTTTDATRQEVAERFAKTLRRTEFGNHAEVTAVDTVRLVRHTNAGRVETEFVILIACGHAMAVSGDGGRTDLGPID